MLGSTAQQRSIGTNSESTITILLVEPLAIVRQGLVDLISSFKGCKVIADVGTAAEALTALAVHSPDILVCELSFPCECGLSFLKSVREQKKDTKILVLTSLACAETLQRAREIGFMGVVLKGDLPQHLAEAIQKLSISHPYTSTGVLQLEKTWTQNSPANPLECLSKREQEVFHLLAAGMQNTTIAKKLFISPRTVETHRARIVRKLGFQSNGELIRFAIKNGLSSL